MEEKKKVIIVDDDKDLCKTMSKVLKSNGYEVITANDGEEGITQALLEIPDIILLDIMMPRMDGFQFLEQLRSDAHLEEIPVLIISVKHDINVVIKLRRYGVEEFLIKPFDPLKLLKKIEHILEKNFLKFEEFKKVDIRVGRIIEVSEIGESKKKLCDLRIDFGEEIGVKSCILKASELYSGKDLKYMMVAAVVNLKPKRAGEHISEVLLLGVMNEEGKAVLLTPEDEDVPLGSKVV